MKRLNLQNNGSRVENGFTLVELLAVIAVVALLAVLFIPAAAGSRTDVQAFQCQNNEKQLTLAWQMYAEDNKDLLAPNDFPYSTSYFAYPNKSFMQNWVVGTMEQPFDSRVSQELVPTTSNMHTNSCLAGYVITASTFHCPAEAYIDPYSHAQHDRSYSMNAAVGTLWFTHFNTPAIPIGTPVGGGWLPGNLFNANQTTWLTYGKMTSLTKPGPAGTFVFMEENPFAINDGSISIPAAAGSGATYLIGYPAANHNGAGSISFADGHVVIHKWLDVRTFSPQFSGLQSGFGDTSSMHQNPDDPDCFYLAPVTSALR